MISRRKFLRDLAHTGLWLPVAPAIIKAQEVVPFRRKSSGAPENALVTSWASRVVVNGGAAPSGATRSALSTFANGLDSNGLTSKMKVLNCIVPDSLIASMTPLIVGTGNDPWIVVGSVSISSAGLQTSGNSGYFKSGANPNTMFANNNNAGHSCYNTAAGGTASDSLGFCFNGGTGFGRFGATLVAVYTPWDVTESSSFAGTPGFTSINRTSSTNVDVYEANSGVAFRTAAHSTSATTAARPNLDVWFGTWNNSGSAANGQPSRYSYASFHDGFNSTDAQAEYNLVQALRVALGGGYA